MAPLRMHLVRQSSQHTLVNLQRARVTGYACWVEAKAVGVFNSVAGKGRRRCCAECREYQSRGPIADALPMEHCLIVELV